MGFTNDPFSIYKYLKKKEFPGFAGKNEAGILILPSLSCCLHERIIFTLDAKKKESQIVLYHKTVI